MAVCFRAHVTNLQDLTLNGFLHPKKKEVKTCSGCGYFRDPNFCGLNANYAISAWTKACDRAISKEDYRRAGR